MSDEYSEKPDAPYWGKFRQLHERDDKLYWVWPDWFGYHKQKVAELAN